MELLQVRLAEVAILLHLQMEMAQGAVCQIVIVMVILVVDIVPVLQMERQFTKIHIIRAKMEIKKDVVLESLQLGGTCGNMNGGNDKTVESPSNDSDKNSLAKVANKISFPLGEEFSNEFQITSQFGNRDPFMTDNGETLPFHSGIDISAAEGTRINSVSDGVVTEVNYSDSLGNYVVVHHDNGTEKGVYTRYAHCGDVDVGVGTVVVAGEQIASVGMTGKTTGPHLHLSYDGDGDGNYASSEADNPLRILGY